MSSEPFVPFDEKKAVTSRSSVRKVVFIGIGIIILFVLVQVFTSTGVNNSRDRARTAATMQAMWLMRTEIVLCSDGYPQTEIYPPEDDGSVCESSDYTWENISNYLASWGGCEFIVEHDPEGRLSELQYCATLKDGELVRCGLSSCERLGYSGS